jgi:hypothetical protein
MPVIARRVLELLPARELERLLTVEELAELLGTSAEWVRRHQAALGGYRLSDGDGRNPIRFRAGDVERFLERRRLTPPPSRSAGSRNWRGDPLWLLP